MFSFGTKGSKGGREAKRSEEKGGGADKGKGKGSGSVRCLWALPSPHINHKQRQPPPSSLLPWHCHLSRRRRVQLFAFAVGGCNKYNKRGSRHFWLSSRHLDAERVQSPSLVTLFQAPLPSPPLSMAVVKGFVSLSHDSAMQHTLTHTHTHWDRICGTGQDNRKVYFLFATVSPSFPSLSILFLSFSVHAQLFYKINFPIAD